MMRDITIDILMQATSPITHMSGTEGNEAVLMTEPIVVDGIKHRVPVLTGNAIRHRAIRSPGFLWLIARLGMQQQLTARQANFMVNGGAVSESTRDANLTQRNQARTLMPLVSVLGGCMAGDIIPGRLHAGFGTMICRENTPRLRAMFGDWCDDMPTLRASDDFVGQYQYTRGDATRYVQPVDPGASSTENLMIFSGEQVMVGAAFVCRLRLRRATDLETGSLLHALRQWDGVIGGQASRGHGQFDVSYRHDIDDVDALITGYEDHIDGHADAIKAWIKEAV